MSGPKPLTPHLHHEIDYDSCEFYECDGSGYKIKRTMIQCRLDMGDAYVLLATLEAERAARPGDGLREAELAGRNVEEELGSEIEALVEDYPFDPRITALGRAWAALAGKEPTP